MKKTIYFPATLIILPFLLLANGGPMDWSSVTGTGNLNFSESEDILLVSETLAICIDEDYIEVEVIYNLHNNGPLQNVNYAFPIEYSVYFSTWEDIAYDSIHFLDFKIFDEDVQLSSERIIGDKPFQITTPDGSEECYYGWFKSELNFQPNADKRLIVSYRCRALYEDFITSKSFLPSFSNRYIRYNLEPASYWSSQPVENFFFILHAQDVINRGGSFTTSPEWGQWFDDSVFIIKQVNVDFQQDSLLEFIYEIRDNKMTDYFQEYQMPGEYLVNLTASSNLSPQSGITYSPENLTDGFLNTAWVEGVSGQGIGETIVIELDDFLVGWIGIVNGYTKSDQSYQENSRIKTLSLTLYTDNPEYSGTVYSTPLEIDLEDLGRTGINQFNYAHYVQPLFSRGMGIPVNKIEIEITDIYPGTKYEDLAASELVILGYPEDEYLNW